MSLRSFIRRMASHSFVFDIRRRACMIPKRCFSGRNYCRRDCRGRHLPTFCARGTDNRHTDRAAVCFVPSCRDGESCTANAVRISATASGTAAVSMLSHIVPLQLAALIFVQKKAFVRKAFSLLLSKGTRGGGGGVAPGVARSEFVVGTGAGTRGGASAISASRSARDGGYHDGTGSDTMLSAAGMACGVEWSATGSRFGVCWRLIFATLPSITFGLRCRISERSAPKIAGLATLFTAGTGDTIAGGIGGGFGAGGGALHCTLSTSAVGGSKAATSRGITVNIDRSSLTARSKTSAGSSRTVASGVGCCSANLKLETETPAELSADGVCAFSLQSQPASGPKNPSVACRKAWSTAGHLRGG